MYLNGSSTAELEPNHEIRICFTKIPKISLEYVDPKNVEACLSLNPDIDPTYRPITQNRPLPSASTIDTLGSGIGGISALFGIGGGALTAPLLAHFGVRMHQAIGTAAACGFPIGVVATLVYTASNVPSEIIHGANLGYVFLPAWFGIVVASTPFARVGALLAHRLNEQSLKRSFGWVVLVFGIRFIWINIAQ